MRPGYGGPPPGYGNHPGIGQPPGPRPPYGAPLPPAGYPRRPPPPLPPAGYHGRPPSSGGAGGAIIAVLFVFGMVASLVVFATMAEHDNDSTSASGITPSYSYPATTDETTTAATSSETATPSRNVTASRTALAGPTTAAAGPTPVAATATNPLFGNRNNGLVNIRCSLPQWAANSAAATAFFDAASTCLGKMWQPMLQAQNLPFHSPRVAAPARSADASSPCSSSGNFAAYFCSANDTIYMPLDTIQTDAYGSRWYVYLEVFAHEYGHHIQALTGIMDRQAQEREDAGAGSDKGLELSRRTELEAQCFAGMFVGSSLYAGLFTNDQAVFMQRDQYTRGDETQKTDMHDHGVGRHYGDWFVNVGEKYNRVWRCNTWTAPSSEVS